MDIAEAVAILAHHILLLLCEILDMMGAAVAHVGSVTHSYKLFRRVCIAI